MRREKKLEANEPKLLAYVSNITTLKGEKKLSQDNVEHI